MYEGTRTAEDSGLPIEEFGEITVVMGTEDIDCATYDFASGDGHHGRERLRGDWMVVLGDR